MATVINAAKDVNVQISLQTQLQNLLGLYPEVELLDPMIILCSMF
jgi:hypothetical protein